MDNVLKLVEHWIFNQSGGENVIDEIKNLHKKTGKKIPLSKLLSVSHVFCEQCDLYTPCTNVSDWLKVNPELYDAEILCFADLLEECSENIEIDIDESKDERLRQLYTMILSV